MNIESIKIMAHELLDKRHIENDYIEYKKSDDFKDKILKTVCAFANNYMNREIVFCTRNIVSHITLEYMYTLIE